MVRWVFVLNPTAGSQEYHGLARHQETRDRLVKKIPCKTLLLVKAGRFTASDLLQKLNKQKHEHLVVVVVTATIGPLI